LVRCRFATPSGSQLVTCFQLPRAAVEAGAPGTATGAVSAALVGGIIPSGAPLWSLVLSGSLNPANMPLSWNLPPTFFVRP